MSFAEPDPLYAPPDDPELAEVYEHGYSDGRHHEHTEKSFDDGMEAREYNRGYLHGHYDWRHGRTH